MNINFLKVFLNNCNFSLESAKEITAFADNIIKNNLEREFDSIIYLYESSDYDYNKTDLVVNRFSSKYNLDCYSVWLLVLIFAAKKTKLLYQNKNIPDAIFWETFCDLKFKAYECKTIHDIYGICVADWYPRFYRADILKLGRMQYDSVVYPFEKPFIHGDLIIKKGDPIKAIHIPSSGEPFNKEARINSYKKAYEFFCDSYKNEILVCRCNSWLLYPEYKNILPINSNILSFTNEFNIVTIETWDKFLSDWIVFGKDAKKPYCDLPENTSLQKCFKKHLLSGGKFGAATGILLFDGKNILTEIR